MVDSRIQRALSFVYSCVGTDCCDSPCRDKARLTHAMARAWRSGDIAGIGFGASTDTGTPGIDSEALAKALEAFGLAGLGNTAP